MGKLYDDRGNRMSPSYSTKNGVRYRFYVSSVLLRGRKSQAGTVGRVPAQDIEDAVIRAVQKKLANDRITSPDVLALLTYLSSVTVHSDHLLITVLDPSKDADDSANQSFTRPWSRPSTGTGTALTGLDDAHAPDQALIQSIVRSHVWLKALQDGTHTSVERLAEASQVHPKVVRLALRLAFLSPEATASALTGDPSGRTLTLAAVPKLLPLSWTRQRSMG